MTQAFETVLERLDDYGCDGVARFGGGYSFQCPAHMDEQPSLSVTEGDEGQVLLYCFAGCSTQEVISALDLEWADLFDTQGRVPVSHYIYRLADGQRHIRVVRYDPKGFTQDHWDKGRKEWIPGLNGVERVPYNLPGLVDGTGMIWVTEGEKDADTLSALGLRATTLLGGAGKWRPEYAAYFKGADVTVVADADEPGRAGAELVSRHIRDVARSVRVVVPAYGKDATDHVQAGYGVDAFVEEGSGLDEFGPLDWDTYEVEKTEWLLEPYVPRGGRVLAFGPAGSLKSLWAMWLGAHVAKEGGKVAYFSLEMLPSDTARRLKQLNPPKSNFTCFTKGFKLGSPSHLEKVVRGLKDYDLIVVDSWTAARTGEKDSNEAVSALDTEFFLPLIKHTGAAIVMIDNTGHAVWTDKGKVKMDHARGASAKGDKADVTIWFDRPFEDNNYLTRIHVKKMRMDYPMPKPVEVITPRDRIEFYYAEMQDEHAVPGSPMWPGLDVADKPEPSPYDEMAELRLKRKFGAIGE